ncbi:hypothetical protein HK096_011253, partial [Nowakowskiella sp. JEL0078]
MRFYSVTLNSYYFQCLATVSSGKTSITPVITTTSSVKSELSSSKTTTLKESPFSSVIHTVKAEQISKPKTINLSSSSSTTTSISFTSTTSPIVKLETELRPQCDSSRNNDTTFKFILGLFTIIAMETIAIAFVIYRVYWHNHFYYPQQLNFAEASGKTSLQSSEKSKNYSHNHQMSIADLSVYRIHDMENLRTGSSTNSFLSASVKSQSRVGSALSLSNPSGVFVIGETENGLSKTFLSVDINSVLSSSQKGSSSDSHLFLMSEFGSPETTPKTASDSSDDVLPGSNVHSQVSVGSGMIIGNKSEEEQINLPPGNF